MKIATYDLATRVRQFGLLELPGQPPMMHMGTSYLVNDLWREVQTLCAQRDALLAELKVTNDLLVTIAAGRGCAKEAGID